MSRPKREYFPQPETQTQCLCRPVLPCWKHHYYMKKVGLLAAALFCMHGAQSQTVYKVAEPVEWVNTLMGTDSKVSLSNGNTYPAIAGKNIMEVSDCKTCHKPDEKSIGPSFKQVTEKYKNDPAAPDALAKKIINGGGGVWGETAMSAHPGLSNGEAHQLVEYIFSLGGNSPKAKSLPITGSLNPTMGNELKDNGVLYLLASYTDKGGPGIKPITGTNTVQLLNPKLPAAAYSKADGVSTYQADGIKLLIPASGNGWAVYNDLDLTTVNGIEITYMVQDAQTQGYVVEAFLDNANGTRLGETTIGPGAQAKVPNKASISFSPINDGKKHHLYIKMRPTDPGKQVPLGIASFMLRS